MKKCMGQANVAFEASILLADNISQVLFRDLRIEESF
jgi:hypothetical protein